MSLRASAALPGTFFAAVAGFVMLVSSAAAPPIAAPGSPQIPQAVRAQVRPDGWVRVIAELKLPSRHVPEASLRNLTAVLAQRQIIAARRARLLAKLPAGGFRVVREYQTIPYVALDVSAGALTALGTNVSEVERVMPDSLARPGLAESVPLVQGDQAWAVGYDGTGTAIAVLDTGVDRTHPFLTGKVVEEACYSSTVASTSQTFCPNGLDEQIGPGSAAPCPLGDCIHGTHVAGIAAGNGAGAGQPFSGVAKGAQLIAVQVFSRITDPTACGGVAPCAGAFTSDILAGLERVYILSWQLNIASVNMSLGGDLFGAPCDTEPYKPIIDNLRAVQIPTVVASGNSGSGSMIATPACVSSAVSVGSTSKADAVSWFSNIAPFLSLLAPGESITSSIPGGSYLALSGTSMAAPHVAGAWGLLKQAVPGASVSTILGALQQTGLPISDTRLFIGLGTTIPRIRLFQALASLAPITNPPPTITMLSPASARAGSGALTLSISGSGFDAFSVARWNGASRPTTVVSATKLNVSIPATDLATVGTAQVTVFTPAPGGGTSSALPFVIDPPPTLTPSPTAVAPGGQVTLTLAEGFGGSSDWLALAAAGAADNSYLQWTYVGAGVINRTWTVTMPTTAGTYEFRLFVNNVRRATSGPVTVDASLTPAPVVSSLSPNVTAVGGPAFTLTINGSSFVSSSVVKWNGATRPTTFVSATKLQAAIGAADIAAVGTAQVTVATPGPGGGTSSALTFAISVQPSLAVSATNVAGGDTVTVTLTNGLGGSTDWLAFAATTAANTSYLQYTYVGGGVTTRTWTVTTPATGGAFEFRLFPNNGYTRAATSPTVNVSGTNPAPVLGSLSPASAVAGGGAFTLTAAGSGFVNTSVVRWNGANRPTTFLSSTQLQAAIPASDLATTGTAQVTVFSPSPGGGTSSPLSFSITATSPTLTVNATNVVGGTNVTVTLTNGAGGATDWLAFAATSAPNTSYLQYVYVGSGVTTRTWTITTPTTAGTYEFRLFLNNGYTRAATSPPITVTQPSNPVPPVLTVNSTTVAPGGTVTVTLTGGAGGGSDWLAFAPTSAPNTSYLQYTYVGAGITTRTWTVTVPTATGTYEFRLFLNNGYTRAATSPTVTVGP